MLNSQITYSKNHLNKWFFFIKYPLFLFISFLSWNFFGLLFVLNIYILFNFLEKSNRKPTHFISYFLESYFFMLLWHLGATGWLITIDSGVFAILANSIIFSVPFAIVFISKKIPKQILLIFIWVLFEILINSFSFSTPLLTIGNALSNQIYIIQWYKYTSVIGGSVWLLLITYFIFNRKKSITLILLVLPSFISIVIFYKSKNNNLQLKKQLTATIFNPQYHKANSSSDLSLYVQNKLQYKTDLLIMPESIIQFNSINYTNTLTYKIFQKIILKNNLQNIFFGVDIKYKKNKRLNAALFLSKNHSLLKVKKKLVPYSEYLPKIFSFLNSKPSYIFNVKDDSNKIILNYHITPVICYEAFFPFYISKNSTNSKLILLIASERFLNGSYYGKKQYNNILKIRAIENNLPIIKCSSYGNSMLINEKGIIVDASDNKEFYNFKIPNYLIKTDKL